MGRRSSLRLTILAVLIVSLMMTLLARLYVLQLASGDQYRLQAASNTMREVASPAVRGLILDQAGRPIVANRASIVVTVDRAVLQREADRGAGVIERLAGVLGVPAEQLSDRLKTCGAEGAKPPPVCWNGSPYQPIPIIRDISDDKALFIMENRTQFPGVTARLDAIRIYPAPFQMNAAHLLGYLGPVTEEQLTAQGDTNAFDRLRRTDVVGRSGLEATYDDQLRGKPSVTTFEVDTTGRVTATVDERPAVPGNYLVTNIDARLQASVESALLAAIQRAQAQGYPGDSGAAVVLDVRNGHVLAMASYPTYDPDIWVGGVSRRQFKELVTGKALSSNALQGLFAPGSTFKVVSTVAAGREGFNLYGQYRCPNQLKLGTQIFRNFESAGYGRISLQRALEVSCNTVFYGIADDMWTKAGGNDATKDSPDPIAQTARMFGLGAQTGIDLPNEAAGRIASRAFKLANWEAKRDSWCANAVAGYPQTRLIDPKLADYYTALDKENCADGFRWREGDALNAAIGQGDTAVTPLQMASVYAAIANGGTVYRPQVVKGIIGADGKVIQTFDPVVESEVKASRSTMTFLHNALRAVTTDGSGASAFAGFPLDRIPVASKTGSAQVTGGKVSTSWFAAYAPANDPKYAVVVMVTQGGTGGKTSGPSVRAIFEDLFGVRGSTIDPARSVLIGGQPASRLPTVRPDGTPVAPSGRMSGVNDPRQGSG